MLMHGLTMKLSKYVPYSVPTNALSFYGCNFIVLWSSIYCGHSSGHLQVSENKNTNIIN